MVAITPTNSVAEALTMALAAATREHPDQAAKLQRAYVIASTRVVAAQGATGQTWWVQSQYIDDEWYLCDSAHNACTCRDQANRGGLCKHLWAVALRRWALQCVTEGQRQQDYGRFYYAPMAVGA